jgi:hypothetical protein
MYDYLSRKNFALHHSSTLLLGQVISLACWKSTARLNSFLRQTNNNLYVIIAVEKATGPSRVGDLRI